MPTEAAVLEALRPVEDPELHQSIVDLDMVKEVAIDGGRVAVTVALTVSGCPLKPEITRRVSEAVQPLDGVESVDVDLTVMDDEQRQAVAERLRQQHAGGAAAADGRPARVEPVHRRPHPSARSRVGEGRRREVVGHDEPRRRAPQRGHKVAAVDADVWGFSMPRMLGIDHPPVVLDDVIIPPEANGVNLISMGFFAREDQPVVWRGPMLHKALEQFLTDVHWDEPDFLVVDMPPGTGDIALSMAQFLPRAEVLIVTTPQPAAQRVAQRAAYMSQKVNLDVMGVIENMSWFRGDDGKAYELFGAGGGRELAEQLGVPLLGQVPLVPELRVGADEGRPIVVTDPDDEASRVFVTIAERVEELAPKKVYRPELKIT